MNVTALLAHPDDELACAGAFAKFVDAGDTVTLVTAFSDSRGHELHHCANVLGVTLIERIGHQAKFVWNQDAIKTYEPLVSQTNPDLLISHRLHDNNTSHVPLAQIMRTIARKNNVSLWEIDAAIPGGLETDGIANNCLVDITKQVTRKYKAVDGYKSVIVKYGSGWREALLRRDKVNGWLLHMTDDAHFAEAFRIVKSVWK